MDGLIFTNKIDMDGWDNKTEYVVSGQKLNEEGSGYKDLNKIMTSFPIDLLNIYSSTSITGKLFNFDSFL